MSCCSSALSPLAQITSDPRLTAGSWVAAMLGYCQARRQRTFWGGGSAEGAKGDSFFVPPTMVVPPDFRRGSVGVYTRHRRRAFSPSISFFQSAEAVTDGSH